MNGNTAALAQVSEVLIAVFGSVAILASLGLGIVFLRSFVAFSREGKVQQFSHAVHILGVVAGIGALGSITLYIMRTLGEVGTEAWTLPF